MKIIVASPYLRFEKAGGSVFPYSLAEGLAKVGYEVALLGLTLGKEETLQNIQKNDFVNKNLTVRWLNDPVKKGWGRYPKYNGFESNLVFQKACENLIKK